uniref:PB1-like domain-containing protein n=1 Tax=Arachis hypogaea TaxID=3818 RepID=C0L2V6_ARAHY|nr:unknown [Arachis hypogaea]
MEDYVVPVFHHSGHFIRDNQGVLLYIDGKVNKFPKMDIDLICFFDLKTLFKGLGYLDYKAMYWFDPKTPDLERGLHPIKGDLEINHLRENKQMNQETDEFYLYFDHPIMVIPPEDINLNFDADADVEEESSDDGYKTTEDEPYRPPLVGFEDKDSDSDCLIEKRNTRKVGKKTEGGVGMQSSQRNIGARRKALKENKKAIDGPSTIKTNTNGATGSGSKYAGSNMSRAAVAAKPSIRAPKNAGQKGYGSTSSGPTANGPKTVRTSSLSLDHNILHQSSLALHLLFHHLDQVKASR